MKALVLVILQIFLISLVMGQEKVSEELIKDTKAYLADQGSLPLYRKVMSHFGKLPKGEIKEKLLEVGILGARVLKLQKEFDLYVKYLSDNFQGEPLLEKMHIKNLSDMCQSCKGSGTAPRACSKCRGTGKCSNGACSGGQVPGYDRVGGKFVQVLRTCIICNGSSSCASCSSSGESMGTCMKCMKTGYVYNPDKASKELGVVLASFVADPIQPQIVADNTPVVNNNDTIEINGVVYTKEQIAELEKASTNLNRNKTDNPVTATIEVTKNDPQPSKVNDDITEVLSNIDNLIDVNAGNLISKLQGFVNDYPQHEKISEVKTQLQFCGLYKEAQQLESIGSISKAIQKYGQALKIKDSEKLQLKLQSLDEQTIGL